MVSINIVYEQLKAGGGGAAAPGRLWQMGRTKTRATLHTALR